MICGLFRDNVSNLLYSIEGQDGYELEKIQEKAVMAYFSTVLDFPKGTEKNQENPHSVQGASQIQVRSITT
jgi:hypothetical protein